MTKSQQQSDRTTYGPTDGHTNYREIEKKMRLEKFEQKLPPRTCGNVKITSLLKKRLLYVFSQN